MMTRPSRSAHRQWLLFEQQVTRMHEALARNDASTTVTHTTHSWSSKFHVVHTDIVGEEGPARSQSDRAHKKLILVDMPRPHERLRE